MLVVMPAIDIRKGKVVRLYRGLYSKETVYSDNPLEVAKNWREEGAQFLHVIDLDGAFYGELKNLDIIKQIIQECDIGVHLGGGIRSLETIKDATQMGVHKVIMSTKIFEDKNFLTRLESSLLKKIIVSIDSKAGIVLDKGWTGRTQLKAEEAVKTIEIAGIELAVITNISQDGTLSGCNTDFLEKILEGTKMKIIAAGGIASLDDVKALRRLQDKYSNLYGVIIGKALYENQINLREAIISAK